MTGCINKRRSSVNIEEGMYLINPQLSEMITVTSNIKQLSTATYGDNTRAKVQCIGENVRYWLSGANPNPSNGFKLCANEYLTLHTSMELENFKFTKAVPAGGNVELAIEYYQ